MSSRTEANLVKPAAEDPQHKDLEMPLGEKTVKLRWNADLGYVVIGEKNAEGQMVDYDSATFREVNAGQLERSGGGRIPSQTSQNPEFFQPPTGDASLIYRRDPDSGKEVIVGYRTDGERYYFQSQATMDAVNAKADEGKLAPPTRPPAPSGDEIPPKSEFIDGHMNMQSPATNGDNKTYIWRWDADAGRYCAVADSTDGGKSFNWFNQDQYQSRNRGPEAVVMQATPIRAPSFDPSQGLTPDDGPTAVRFDEDLDSDQHGGSYPRWGSPMYVTDRDTGHQVMVGVRVKGEKGAEDQVYYFDDQQMARYNDSAATSGGRTYYKAKDLDGIPDEFKKAKKDVEPNNDDPPQRSDNGQGAEEARTAI
ncbi:hypothetical protein [Roseateles sp. YR242]|uniref:hypothetical protein n=1 Tax=Roseateles sp. YR242 TaxID=1855305 RepID=UPI0011607EC9|nr:hypothetical protein [Roseateles sp. YR242]